MILSRHPTAPPAPQRRRRLRAEQFQPPNQPLPGAQQTRADCKRDACAFREVEIDCADWLWEAFHFSFRAKRNCLVATEVHFALTPIEHGSIQRPLELEANALTFTAQTGADIQSTIERPSTSQPQCNCR